jgi:hypothetical protein
MSIKKVGPQHFIISDIINDRYIIEKRYLYYTKKEAIALFKQHIKNVKDKIK